MKFLRIFCILLIPCASFSQSEGTLLTSLEPLELIVGTWHGEGWIINKNGEKKRFSQTEVIKSKVNGQVLLIDGLGYAIEDSVVTDQVIHDVVGMILIEPDRGHATMMSILEGQGRSEVDLYMLEDGKSFQWSFTVPETEITVRFTEDLSQENRWVGTGEVLLTQDQSYTFFEMILYRQ